MKRIPLRAAYAAATLSTLLALLLTEPSLAHVDVQPRLVAQTALTELRIELPRLRAGAPPVRLEVEAQGVDVLASRLLGVAGGETRWSVRIRVSPAVPAGELPLVLRGVFADGESVEVDSGITVVPGAEEPAADAFPWVAVAAGAALALAVAAAGLVLARRRS